MPAYTNVMINRKLPCYVVKSMFLITTKGKKKHKQGKPWKQINKLSAKKNLLQNFETVL